MQNGKSGKIFGNFYFLNEKNFFFLWCTKIAKKEKKRKEKMKKSFKKFLSGRGPKSLPLILFFSGKNEENGAKLWHWLSAVFD